MQLHFKFKVTLVLLAACLSFGGYAFSEEFAEFIGKVNANNINVRVDATTGAPIACTLARGQLIEVVRESYDWYKIRLPKTATSYIKKNLVECINPSASLPDPAKCLNAKVIAERVNIRLGPSEDSWILGKADKLSVVNILAEKGAWYKIEPVHQSFGWVHKKFVDKAQAAVIMEEAKSPGQLIIEGTVSPYGVVLWRQATHKLITAENKVYFLKGNRKALNSLNYHRVKVTGKLITAAENKHPIIHVAVIEALN